MSYLKFDKNALVNLEYSLNREILSTNRNGGYLSTTIIGCNTRKYHGLLICPIDEFGGENHVLLSSLDETLVQREKTFNLGIHRYPGNYEPRGHKYIVEFEYEPTPTITYRVGGMLLKKELLLIHHGNQLMIRYTLLDAHSPTVLRLKPFLAFRKIHELSKANLYANTKYNKINNGVETKLYADYPLLRMQLNKKNEFIPTPDWYYNIEYNEELKRGYEYREDLFVPGYFEVPIKKGESIIFSASIKEENPTTFKRYFEKHLAERPPKNSYVACLKNASQQFIIQSGKNTEIVAGYPWLGYWGLDMFVSLPGLTLAAAGDTQLCKTILDNATKNIKDGSFSNEKQLRAFIYTSIDVPLWYIWAVQQYKNYTGNSAEVWKSYGKKIIEILDAYRKGKSNVQIHENGLMWQGETGKALTWMDAIIAGKPVTQRAGYAVEINALWYNAICFAMELAKENNNKTFDKQWTPIKKLIEENFYPVFWSEQRQHLADYVDETGQNIFTRPNQIFATSLQYSPINDEVKAKILKAVKHELLTTKGIRTLSPKNPLYKGRYEGNQTERDNAHHQGTAMPWLLGHYVEGNFKLHGKNFIAKAKEIINAFEEDITTYGIASIGELYDGDPPQAPEGSISQAWSVAEILRIMRMIDDMEKNG
jgi:predicted glycogen debranching enzyme